MCNMCHVYNFINEELPVHAHGHAVLEVLLDPWVQSLHRYIIKYMFKLKSKASVYILNSFGVNTYLKKFVYLSQLVYFDFKGRVK